MTIKYRHLLFCLLIFVFNSCKTAHIKCPDGRTCIVSKHPEKSWPSYAKESQTTIKASIGILDKLKAENIDFNTKNSVVKLRQELDQMSLRFEIIAKSAYLGYNIDPCNNGERYWKIQDDLMKLIDLTNNLTNLSQSGNMGTGIESKKIKSLIDNLKLTQLK